jgi:hypothetical protein
LVSRPGPVRRSCAFSQIGAADSARCRPCLFTVARPPTAFSIVGSRRLARTVCAATPSTAATASGTLTTRATPHRLLSPLRTLCTPGRCQFPPRARSSRISE